jgi:hypothetical protein
MFKDERLAADKPAHKTRTFTADELGRQRRVIMVVLQYE